MGLRNVQSRSHRDQGEDFAIRASVSKTAPVIVWIRLGNCTNKRLQAWFEDELPSIIAMIESGNRLIEIAG